MLQPTTRAASILVCRATGRRVVCAAAGRLTGPRQPVPARSFWTSPPRRQKSGGEAVLSVEDLIAEGAGETAPDARRTTTSTATAAATEIETAASANDDLPWYLQEDVPRHTTLAAADIVVPPVPVGAPTVVGPLLTFAAEDMGLDDLRLLDLRALEPAAGLGPDLLMLFGTARSDRHLHISADRLVRWLRQRGIHANADGLLGRNELKIKLRRQARRAKLLGTSGAAPRSRDDGISTQWVCVHARTHGGDRTNDQREGQMVDAAGRLAGFGSLTRTGSTLVVQICTAAKREQLDLETLWERTLARSLKGEGAAEEAADRAGPADRNVPVADPEAAIGHRFFSTSTRTIGTRQSSVLAALEQLQDRQKANRVDTVRTVLAL